ncbi:hypothetical protein M2422_004473 [Enterobacter sp. SLBN-59]|nr:hypothetical protein [Enterobacter sp. SLBN-59]
MLFRNRLVQGRRILTMMPLLITTGLVVPTGGRMQMEAVGYGIKYPVQAFRGNTMGRQGEG